ncbi:30S ribosomal protein S20 [Candidatus Parcubacteria bacterium]|nr:30S ribosomal protein S20 [Candidatus Parcubacteria bacterium]
MPITKSAKKAIRGSEKKKVFNLRRKKKVEDAVKSVKKLVKEGKIKEANALLPQAYSALDKAAKGNTIKDNTASRKKSRLNALVKKAALK